MANSWQDMTGYRRGEEPRIPRTWELYLGGGDLRIIVTRHIHYGPDKWFLRCGRLNIELHELKSKDVERAKEEALKICFDRAQWLTTCLAEAHRVEVNRGEGT